MLVRGATIDDNDAIWAILEPVIRAGETYALPTGMARNDALAWWNAPDHHVFVAAEEGLIVGTGFLRANQMGGGAHVANCGYITAPTATGRGVARALCSYSLELARKLGFRAMQFNFVVSTNERAVRLWQSFGFQIVGQLPEAFCHPRLGFVDVLVMYLHLN